jgi:hypothetical protein
VALLGLGGVCEGFFVGGEGARVVRGVAVAGVLNGEEGRGGRGADVSPVGVLARGWGGVEEEGFGYRVALVEVGLEAMAF